MGTKASPPEAGLALHILASGGLYGIERMLLGLLPALQQRGRNVALLCLNESGQPEAAIGESMAQRGVPVYRTVLGSRLDLRGILRTHVLIRRLKPRIVHVHGYKATIVGGALSLLNRLPIVGTCHSEALRSHDLATYVRIETPIIRRFVGMVAVSEAIKEELENRRVPSPRIRVIPNGIADSRNGDAASAASMADGLDPVLAVVGRLVPGKNVQLLIDAMGHLKADFPNIGLLVAGDGPYRRELETRAQRLGLDNAVRFLGFVEDVDQVLAAADAFVLPSDTEGSPISLFEAMSFGLPIIASRVGSVPSVVRHDAEALLVRPGDRYELVSALERVLPDAGLREQLGKSARASFREEYTADKMAERYDAFYDSILES